MRCIKALESGGRRGPGCRRGNGSQPVTQGCVLGHRAARYGLWNRLVMMEEVFQRLLSESVSPWLDPSATCTVSERLLAPCRPAAPPRRGRQQQLSEESPSHHSIPFQLYTTRAYLGLLLFPMCFLLILNYF